MRNLSKLVLLVLVGVLSGCQVLYLLTGKGQKDALYELPAESRVLVMVDPRPGTMALVEVPAALGESLTAHLYKYHVADKFVDQARLVDLRKDPRFEKMGIADIARQVEADVVVYVDLVTFAIETPSQTQLIHGHAQALVKVVDKNGKRLWPPSSEALGYGVEARVQPELADQTTPLAVREKLLHLLTVRMGRTFHAYDLEDKALNK